MAFDIDKFATKLDQLVTDPAAVVAQHVKYNTFEAAEEKLYEDTGNYDEAHEEHLRKELILWANYAEEGPTFDPNGKYLCKTCDMRNGTADCLRVESPIDFQIGGCRIYTYGMEPEKDPPMPKKLTQIEASYSERPVSKRFGCRGCEYSAEAKKPDKDGRSSWCSFWGLHVMPKACCFRNDAPDDRQPKGAE